MNLRLFAGIWSIEARKLMSYRANFWINAFATFLVELVIAFFLWRAIFRESGRTEIGGFTEQGMILYYLVALLLGKLIRGEERESTIAQNIYDGTLTRYLLFPASYFAFKYAEHLGHQVGALVQLAVFGGAGLLLLDPSSLGPITPLSILRALAAVVVGNLLWFLMTYALEAVAFWADNIWSLTVLLRFIAMILGGQMVPLHLFPEWAARLLDLLPFRFLYYFPTMTLCGRIDAASWADGMAIALAWSALLAIAARLVWRRGMLSYTGVGI